MKKQIGETKDVGFQFGIRKTFSVSIEYAWDFMFSEKGLNIWLGKLENELEIKKTYKTEEGIEGFVRVFKPFSHIRLNWKKKDWDNISTVQVRVIGSKGKSIISFHQEKLLNPEQRVEMQEYWNKKINELSNELKRLSQN